MTVPRTFDELPRTPRPISVCMSMARSSDSGGAYRNPTITTALRSCGATTTQIDAGGFDAPGPDTDARWSDRSLHGRRRHRSPPAAGAAKGVWAGPPRADAAVHGWPRRGGYALRRAVRGDGRNPRRASSDGRLARETGPTTIAPAMPFRRCFGLASCGNRTRTRRGRGRGSSFPRRVGRHARRRCPGVAWARHRPAAELPTADVLVLPEETRRVLERLPILLNGRESQPVIVRGPHGSGRRALLGAVARATGRGLLELSDPSPELVGPLATLLNALPMQELELAPGETVELQRWSGYVGPVGVVLGARGGVRTDVNAVTLRTAVPGVDAARGAVDGGARWPCRRRRAGGRFRTPAGTIQRRRIARPRRGSRSPDVACRATMTWLSAMRSMHGEASRRSRRRIPIVGDWRDLAVGDETLRELELLELRCRHVNVCATASAACSRVSSTPGVRALFTGPSGARKTLAAGCSRRSSARSYTRRPVRGCEQVHRRDREEPRRRVRPCRGTRRDPAARRGRRAADAAHRRPDLERPLREPGDQLPAPAARVLRGDPRRDDERRRADRHRVQAADGCRRRVPCAQSRSSAGRSGSSTSRRVMPSAARFLEDLAARCALSGGQIRNAALHASLLALDAGAERRRRASSMRRSAANTARRGSSARCGARRCRWLSRARAEPRAPTPTPRSAPQARRSDSAPAAADRAQAPELPHRVASRSRASGAPLAPQVASADLVQPRRRRVGRSSAFATRRRRRFQRARRAGVHRRQPHLPRRAGSARPTCR